MTGSVRLGRLVTKDRVSGASQAHGTHGHFASGSAGESRRVESQRFEIDARDSTYARGIAANPVIERLREGEVEGLKAGVAAKLADRMTTPTDQLVALVRPVMDKECTQYVMRSPVGGRPPWSINSDAVESPPTHMMQTSNGRLIFARVDEQSPPSALEDMQSLSDMMYAGAKWISVDDPAADDMYRQYAVSALVTQWAQTSNDSSPDSLAMQSAAEDVLGVYSAAGWEDTSRSSAGSEPSRFDLSLGGDTASSGMAVLRDFVQSQYDETQETFKAAGYGPDDTIRLFRGEGNKGTTSVTNPEPFDAQPWTSPLEKYAGEYVDATFRPLSSWTTDMMTAATPYFTGGGMSVLTTEVKVRDIASMYCSGVGCADESEFVIKGGIREGLYVTTPEETRQYRGRRSDDYTPPPPPKETVAIGRLLKYSPGQARDERGRFTSGGGTGSGTDEHGARVDAKAAAFVAAGGHVEHYELYKMDPKDQKALARSLRRELAKQGEEPTRHLMDDPDRREMARRMLQRAVDFTENKQDWLGGRARGMEMLPHLFVMRDGDGNIAGLAAWSVGGYDMFNMEESKPYVYMDFVGSTGETPGVGSAALAELIPSAAKAGVEICGEPLEGAISFWQDSGAEYKPAGIGTREWVDWSVDKVKAMNESLSTDIPYENKTVPMPEDKAAIFKSKGDHEFDFTGTGVPVEYDDLPHTGTVVSPEDPDAVIKDGAAKISIGRLIKDRVSGATQEHGEHGRFTGGGAEWSPTMSQVEADAWAKDSVVKETLYHGTSSDAAQSIRSEGFDTGSLGRAGSNYGNGVYLTAKRDQADYFGAQRGDGSVTLETKVNVKNPANEDDYKEAVKNYDRSVFTSSMDAFDEARAEAKAITAELQRQGFDSVVTSDQVVVFDPKNVTVVTGGGVAQHDISREPGSTASVTKSTAPVRRGEPMPDPDTRSPFWDTPEGQRILGKPVKKYSEDQPRDWHGRFGSSAGVKEDVPEHVKFITDHAAKFYASGGTIERASETPSAQLQHIQRIFTAQSDEVRDDDSIKDDDERTRLMDGCQYAADAMGDVLSGNGYEALIAYDSSGMAVAAISFVPADEDSPELEIGVLGSNKTVDGAACALQHEVAMEAATVPDGSVTSMCTDDSHDFHVLIGRTMSGFTSYWTHEQCVEIAAAKIPTPSAKTVLGTLRKDRESGAHQAHGEHGHFASGSSGIDPHEPPDFSTAGSVMDNRLNKWFEDRGITLDRAGLYASLHMTPADMEVVAKKLIETDKKFPGTLDEVKHIGLYTGTKPTVIAAVANLRRDMVADALGVPRVDGSMLGLTDKYVLALHNPEEFARGIEEQGAHIIDRTADDVLTHELGHVVQNMTEADQPKSSGFPYDHNQWSARLSAYGEGAGERASIFERAAQEAGYLSKARSGFGRPLTGTISRDISDYASKSPGEFHSEVLTLLNHPELMDKLTPLGRQRIEKYRDTLNELAGAEIVKRKSEPSGDGITECDFGLDEEFWRNLRSRVAAAKGKVSIGTLRKYSDDEERGPNGRWISGSDIDEGHQKIVSGLRSLSSGDMFLYRNTVHEYLGANGGQHWARPVGTGGARGEMVSVGPTKRLSLSDSVQVTRVDPAALNVHKDRVSGATQAHGAHGRFAGDGGSTFEGPKPKGWQTLNTGAQNFGTAKKWMLENIDTTARSDGRSAVRGTPSQLNEDQRAALSWYVSGAAYRWNRALRKGGSLDNADDMCRDLQDAILGSRTKTGITVFRGGVSDSFLAGVHVGDVIEDRGFVSTSMTRIVATNFGQGSTPIEIHVPAGSNAIGVVSSENEILLGSGSRFRVDSMPPEGKLQMTYLGLSGSTDKVSRILKAQADDEEQSRFVWLAGDVTVESKRSDKTVLGQLVKDKTSGETQAHGAHGWFTSDASERIAPIDSKDKTNPKGNPFKTTLTAQATMRDPELKGVSEEKVAQMHENFEKVLGVTPEQAQANIVDMFNKSDQATREFGAQWYQNAHDVSFNTAIENGIDPHIGAAITAAMSPGQLWQDNEKMAIQLMEDFNNPTRVLTQAEADKFNTKDEDKRQGLTVSAGQNLRSIIEDPSNTRGAAVLIASIHNFGIGREYGNVDKAVQLAQANDPSKISEILGGAKVRSFFNNIDEPTNPNDVTVDVHMFRALANGDPNGPHYIPNGDDRIRAIGDTSNMKLLTASPSYQNASVGAYPIAADVVRSATDQINSENGTNYTPSQVQAIVWGQQLNDYPRSVINAILKAGN